MLLLVFVLKFALAQPGSMTSLLHFGDIIEKNILTIINDPNRRLEFLINHESLYKYGFDYCDADLDTVVTMEELASCEYNFLHAVGREHKNYESHLMKIGDENKDGKLHFEEWLTAGSVWDLAFGRAMIECLGGKKNFNRKSIYRALGVIGHFYGDMDKEKALDILAKSDLDHNGKWEDYEVGYLQQQFYNEFIKAANDITPPPVQL